MFRFVPFFPPNRIINYLPTFTTIFSISNRNDLIEMSGQKSLLQFFKSTPKRPLSEVLLDEIENDDNVKKQKLNERNGIDEINGGSIKQTQRNTNDDSLEDRGEQKEEKKKQKSDKGAENNDISGESNAKTTDTKDLFNFGEVLTVNDNTNGGHINQIQRNINDDTLEVRGATPKRNQKTLNFGVDDQKIREDILVWSKKFVIIDPKIGPSWFKALRGEFKKPYFEKLNDFVLSERRAAAVYPPPDKVWTWTRQCSLDNVKVVILGQDPYHNPGQAHGLCFSVEVGIPPPPSLINMYKELNTDIKGFTTPDHGFLIGWARQGVLLLNACLTVKKNVPNSHKDRGWEQLTTAVIKYLNEHKKGIVFLLWGSYAQKKADFVDKKKHHILKSVHPSPLSASRGWFGCKHFSKCNELLKSMGSKPIDWNHLPKI